MKKRFIVILLFLMIISMPLMSNAATGSFSVSASSSSINVGSTTNINITAKDCGGKFTITSSDSSIVSVNEYSKWVESGSQSITVTGKKAGTATITVTATDVADTSVNNEEVSGSKTIKITVKDSTSSTGGGSGTNTSTKATLKKLVVAGKTYNNPAKSITVKVSNDVTSAKIVPTTSNGESYKISKENPVKLEEGTNTVKITLASGNVYTVYIRRAAKVDDTPNIIDEEPKPKEEENIFLKSLMVKGVTLEEEKIELPLAPEFIAEIYEYEIILDETMSNITKLDIEAVANKDDCTIEIQGNEEIQDGENIVTITVKSKDGKITKTYKIFVTKCAETEPVIANTDEEPKQEENSFFTKSTLKIIIVAFTSGVAILGIIFAVIEYKYGKNEEQISFEEDDEIGEASFPGITLEKENELEEMYTPEYEEEKTKRKAKSKGKHF